MKAGYLITFYKSNPKQGARLGLSGAFGSLINTF